jgi:hypothetical protein
VRFHALNQIDLASRHAGIEIVTDRDDQTVLGALHALWSRHGVPARIRFDNGGPFAPLPGWARSCGFAFTRAPRRCSSRQGSRGATGGLAPEQSTTASKPCVPRPLAELPAGWPELGKIQFIRFIRSDHKLRLLGRAIAMPDGRAYQYVTATLDLALPVERNLLIADDRGELLTTAKLPIPGS